MKKIDTWLSIQRFLQEASDTTTAQGEDARIITHPPGESREVITNLETQE